MGTTCSTLLLLPAGAVIGHVGDSRVYRLRGEVLEQMTFDHSLVWEMRRAGQIPGGVENVHLPKNIITRSLGPNTEVQVDLEGPLPVQPGDIFLLCSDGLTGPVSDRELAAILMAMPPDQAVRTLVDLANLRGGPDNITAIVVQILALPEGAVDATARTAQRVSATTLLLALAGVFCLATVTLGLLFKLPALLSAVVALVAGIVAMLRRFESKTDAGAGNRGRKVESAPYVTTSVSPDAEVVQQFQSVAQELQKSAMESGREVDWQNFERRTAAAESAWQEGDLVVAVRHFGGAISFAVEQLKNPASAKSPSDSHVDLI